MIDANDGNGMTGKVVWHMTMSLDGFIGDRDDKLDWSFGENEPSELAAEVIRTTGAFLCGGRLVDVVGDNRPYGGAWTGPVLIFTHKDPATNPVPEFTYVSGDIRDVVASGLGLEVQDEIAPRRREIARGLVHGVRQDRVRHRVDLANGIGADSWAR